VYDDHQYQTDRVDKNMPFTTRYFLASVITARPFFSVVLTD